MALNISPGQKKILLYGIPVVVVFAIIAIYQKSKSSSSSSTTTGTTSATDTTAIGTGDLASFESEISSLFDSLASQGASTTSSSTSGSGTTGSTTTTTTTPTVGSGTTPNYPEAFGGANNPLLGNQLTSGEGTGYAPNALFPGSPGLFVPAGVSAPTSESDLAAYMAANPPVMLGYNAQGNLTQVFGSWVNTGDPSKGNAGWLEVPPGSAYDPNTGQIGPAPGPAAPSPASQMPAPLLGVPSDSVPGALATTSPAVSALIGTPTTGTPSGLYDVHLPSVDAFGNPVAA
ncbi:MAG TPA: hypothetical protein VMR97_07925 [Acidimicrobiales bacterium]|nr:hypothetical protein [Acidimicrobiales bacterium]